MKIRAFSVTAFAAAVFAFALPFGVVSSCDGEEVRFTGSQLATFSVPPDDAFKGTLHTDVERNSGVFAITALLAALLGLVSAASGRAGAGIGAAVGLIAMQILAWAVLLTSDGGSNLLVGFWLALLSFASAAVLQLARVVRERRRSGRRVWDYAAVRAVLVLMPTLALILLVTVAVLAA